MTEIPAHDSTSAVEFLRRFQPEGPWALSAIPPEKSGVVTRTFYPSEADDALEWIEARNGKFNLYFHCNIVGGRITSKASKEVMASAQWLHVDVDPRPGEEINAERERALKMLEQGREGVPPATVIIFSGGGYQGYWRLDAPYLLEGKVERAEEFERYNRRLEHVFGADHCHNVDRIMRLPGTVNLPDPKKRRKGRVPELATLHKFGDESHPLADFQQAAEIKRQDGDGRALADDRMVPISGNIPRIKDIEELNEWNVSDRVKGIILTGHLRDIEGPKKGDDSRSGWLFDCLCGLMRHGVPMDVIYGIITDPEYPISESVLDKKRNSERYARRQMSRAAEHVADPRLMRFNDRFAVIGNLGGKCRVVEEVEHKFFVDGEPVTRTVLSKQTFEDFKMRFMNERVDLGTDSKGNPLRTTAGKWWLEHEQRRQYDRLVFSPGREVSGCYNLWRGFSVDPMPGDCGLYLRHVRENICGGKEEIYDYVIRWMARGVQDPGSTGQTCLVLRGGMGTGKGVFAKNYTRLFGRHGLQVTSVKHFLGNFNNHLRDCVALFADEAFFAGDKSHESLLKTLVTEETLMYEAKGVDAESGPNYVHLIMASNSDWVVPAGPNERRYVVLDVANAKQQDEEYFSAISNQMAHGGSEALLDMLLNMDLSEFRVRKFPRTEALSEQRGMTLEPMEEWWLQRLTDGKPTRNARGWQERVPFEHLVMDYVENARRFNVMRRGSATQLGRFFKKYVTNLKQSRPRLTESRVDGLGHEIEETRQVMCLHFPSLAACRADFERVSGMVPDWGEEPGAHEPGSPAIPF